MNIIISVTVFGLVLSVWCIGVFLWLGRYLLKIKAVQRRLGISSETDKDSETLRLWRDMQLSRDHQIFPVEKLGVPRRMQLWIEEAGWKIPFRMVLLIVVGIALAVFLILFLVFGSIWVAVSGIFVVIYLFLQYTIKRKINRENLLERQLLDALGVAARSLRAGHPLVGAFQLIGEEVSAPIGTVFRQIHQEQAFGSDLSGSIKSAARSTRNREFKLFATAVTVQLQSGGNLADLMDTLASVIRERIWLNKRVRVLTAQAQFSKIVLIAMPILMFFMLNIVSRDYLKPLYTTPEGNFFLVLMFVNLLLGSWLMNRMSKIEY